MEEKLHDKYYKYLAEYFQLSFEHNDFHNYLYIIKLIKFGTTA